MSWCCCLPCRWRLGRSLVYRCLLVMADTKVPRRRLTTQRQHSQEPVTTMRHNYYITKAPEYYTAANAAPSYIIKLTTPRLPSTTPPSHRSPSTPKYTYVALACTPRLPSITRFLATTPRLQLITPPKRLNTAPSRPSTTPIRLQSITPQLVLPRPTTPKPRSITLPQATQLQLRPQSITQPRLTTQRLLLCTTLNRNTTPRLHYYTTTYATPTTHYTEAPMYYTTKAPEYFNTTYGAPTNCIALHQLHASPTYYSDVSKY